MPKQVFKEVRRGVKRPFFVGKGNDMLTKEQVLKQLQDMPDTFTIDELLDKLLLLYKIEAGLDQSEKDQVKAHEAIKKKYEKWLQ